MKHLLQSFGATGAIQLANIVSGVMAARMLLPEGRGQLAAVMLWPGLIAIIGLLSIDQAVTFHAAVRRDRISVIVVSGFALTSVLAVVSMLVCYFVLPFVLGAKYAAIYRSGQLYILFIPLNYFGLLLVAGQQGSLRVSLWNVLRALVPVAYVVTVGVFYAAGWADVAGFTIASLVANLVMVLVGLWFFSRDGSRSTRVDFDVIANLLRYGISVHLGVLIAVAAQRLDQTMIAFFLPPDALGVYVVAGSIASGVSLAAGTIGMLAFPKIAAQNTIEKKAILVGRYFRLTAFLTLTSALVVFAASPTLISILFGPNYVAAISLCRIMILGTIPAALTYLLVAAYRAFNRNTIVNYSMFVSLVTAGAMLAILLPRMGMTGAAWSLVASQCAALILLLTFTSREMGITFKQIMFIKNGDLNPPPGRSRDRDIRGPRCRFERKPSGRNPAAPRSGEAAAPGTESGD